MSTMSYLCLRYEEICLSLNVSWIFHLIVAHKQGERGGGRRDEGGGKSEEKGRRVWCVCVCVCVCV
jgi:hypothetical protein